MNLGFGGGTREMSSGIVWDQNSAFKFTPKPFFSISREGSTTLLNTPRTILKVLKVLKVKQGQQPRRSKIAQVWATKQSLPSRRFSSGVFELQKFSIEVLQQGGDLGMVMDSICNQIGNSHEHFTFFVMFLIWNF
ncbi:hypothetical protein M9H77_06970 [Catharanthus roseus]|uniref:Uncharacterized protein n=1 Tax=Catharanthus roseus TaxID=4058 RepID=A0ACC0BTR9_CATRO|nr:hypothetical protein M9H77_06970 [Catharanthus roseus]